MSPRSRLHAWLQSTTFLSIGLIALAAAPSPTTAQTAWTGSTSSDWFDAGNWTPATVPSAGTVVLDTITPNPTTVAGAAASADTVIVGDTATGQLTLDGGGSLTAGSIIIANQAGSTGILNIGAGSLPGTLNAATVTFGAGTGTINFNHLSPIPYTFAAQISGNGAVTVQAGFTFVPPTTIFTADNTYTGGTTITGAVLQLGNGGTTGSIVGDVVLSSPFPFAPGTLAINRSDTVTLSGNISGNGLVAQVGTGTTMLTGDNTHFFTNINAGTLVAGSNTALGLGVINIAAGATLGYVNGVTINNQIGISSPGGVVNLDVTSGTATQAGEITAPLTGSVIKTGAGTLVLTADSTFVNGVTIDAGRLQFGNGGTTGSIAADITNNSVLAFNRSDTFTFGNVISGTGAVEQNGTGITILTANNTYSSGTTINAGRLQIGNGGTTGSIVGDVTNNGTLAFNRDALTFTGVISGSGAVNVQAGTITFTADNTYTGVTTIRTGAQLALGDNISNSGSIAGNVALDGGGLTFNRPDTVTFGGTISGTGVVTQFGSGTTILTGNNTYSGNTRVLFGTLVAGTSSALGTSTVVMNAGATLGYADGVTLANAIAIAVPGAPINLDVASGTATQAGTITPIFSGAVVKTGAGTLVLTADNPPIFLFAITISDGRLQLGNGGTTGSINGIFINNSILAFNRSDTFTVASPISGTGVVEQNGPGTTVLTGVNSYLGGTVLNAGTLSVSVDASLGDPSGGLTFNGGTLQNTGAITMIRDITLNAGGTFRTDADLEIDGNITGSGGLTKTGAATLILAGFNTFDGPTTITAGTLLAATSTALSPLSAITVNAGAALQVADGIFAGAGPLAGDGLVVIGVGSLLVVGLNDQSTTFSGEIHGSGSFEKEGAGTLTLTGTSSIGGVLSVCCGTLDISGGSFTAALTDVAFGTLAITNGGRLQTGDLLNSANLLITGTGSIATASGDTVIGAFGQATATVSNGGKLESLGDAFIGTDSLITVTGTGSTWTIAGALAIGHPFGGPGTLTVADGAVVTVAGTTIIDPSGTLNLGNGGLAGTIAASQIINDGQIVANFTDTLSLTVPIDGVGSLTKSGTGTLILTGTSTYTGATTVNAGRLIVNGTITSAVTVNSGGLLGGSGTVGGFTANAGGTISPGNSVGTLNVTGDVAFAAGATYLVEIDAANNADRIIATGTATLSGGTVQVTKTGGGFTPGTRYTILTANAGVNGTFTGLAATGTGLPLLDLALTYDPNNVYLDVTRNAVTFCGVAGTRNQCAVGTAAESLGAGNTLFDAIVNLTDAAGIRRAFDLLSGEIHASTASTMVEQSQVLRDTVIGRVRQSYGIAGPATALAPEGKVVAFAGMPPGVVPDATPADAAARLFAQAPAAPPAGDAVIAAWTQGIGAWGKRSGDGNAGTLSRSLGGFLIGVDATVDRTWRVGLAAGYTRASFDVDSRASSGNSDNYHVALYGGGQFGALGLRAGASFTWHDISTTRRVTFPGVVDRLKADYSARTTQVFGEVGYAITLERIAFEPFAGLAWVNYRSDRINESGGAAALTGRRQAFDMGFSTLGLRAAATVTAPSDQTAVTLRGTLGWRHAFGDVTPEQRLAFRAGGSPFTVVGVPIARDSLIVEAGVDIDVTSYAKFGFTYSGQFASSAQDHAVKGSLTLRF